MCHYILVCTHFVNYRELISVWYCENSNVIKFNELMRIHNVEKLKELPTFLKKTFKNVKKGFSVDLITYRIERFHFSISSYKEQYLQMWILMHLLWNTKVHYILQFKLWQSIDYSSGCERQTSCRPSRKKAMNSWASCWANPLNWLAFCPTKL